MSAPTTPREYTIKEAAALTGLPASTLRYYESIGVIAPISRGASSKHRVYDEDDLDKLIGVACLAAAGMTVTDMKSYVANAALGAAGAQSQIELLTERRRQLVVEREYVALRQRYVELKVEYWQAVAAGDEARAERIGAEARALADDLNGARRR